MADCHFHESWKRWSNTSWGTVTTPEFVALVYNRFGLTEHHELSSSACLNGALHVFVSHSKVLMVFLHIGRDFPGSGSVYTTTDSGGECGVPYETYFPLPSPAQDKPWYSMESGPVHFTVMSTEHNWNQGSEQVRGTQFFCPSNMSRPLWILFSSASWGQQ